MARNPDLDRLLREVDSLTGSSGSAQQDVEQQPNEQPNQVAARKESSFLKSLGGFFISKVEDEESVEQADAPPPTPNTIQDVAATEPLPEFSVSENSADDLSRRDFAAIYREAGVDENSFTVDKLAALLQDPTLKDQPMSTKTLVLKMALKAQNVSPETPVTDAVRRDRALDAYQKMLNARASEVEQRNAQAVQQINEEVKQYLEQKNAEIDVLRSETQEMRRQAESFAHRRIAEEQRLAELVVPLLEGQPNPVSVNSEEKNQ